MGCSEELGPFKGCGKKQLTLELSVIVLWAVAILSVEVVPVLFPKPCSHFAFVPGGLG